MVVTSTRRARTEARRAAKAAKSEPKQTRNVRTAEQRIADLEAQIEQVKRRAAAKKAKKDPALRHINGAIRSIDKALSSSQDKPTREALTEARTGLAAILTLSGALVPAGRGGRAKPRGVGPVIEEGRLLDYIRAHPRQRTEEIAAGLGTDTAGIRPALVALKQGGRVEAKGKARATRYSIA